MMGTGLDEKAREELSSKIIKLSGEKRKAKDDARKDSSTPNKKTDDKMIKIEGDYRIETINMIKKTIIPKAREGGRQELERLDRRSSR